jgi:glycosyltransferase involved in cell wall biosynthesis
VSHPVAAAIEATGRVNGPTLVIENGIDRSSFPPPRPWEQRTCDVLICGYKQPSLAEELARRLARRLPAHLNLRALTVFEPRDRFLDLLADARVAVCLPRETEGFYLPALEAMVQGALVVCPDCLGNSDFCLDGRTCWMPGWSLEALEHAVMEALSVSDSRRRQVQQSVDQIASNHSLDRERRAFHGILLQLDELWGQTCNGS